jgi:uncharacterized protein
LVGVAAKSSVKVQVSPDRVRAFFLLRPDGEYSQLTELDFYEFLQQSKIKIITSVKERVKILCELALKGSIPLEPYLVAEGQPPVEPTNQEFIWDEKYKPAGHGVDDQDIVNFYELHKLVTVEANAVVGCIRPGREGKDGLDVYGNALKPRKKSLPLRLGEYVALDPDAKTLRATSSGQVILQGNKISVRRVLDIAGNIDFETGNVEAASDVLIRGSVKDLFIVRSKANISVQGMVEAAYLFAEGDITIVGGVKGREKALLEAQGNISAKFLNFVFLQAGGNVEICKEAIDSIIICNGWLDISNGSVIGGQSFGLKGGEIKSLGSPAGVKTIVGVGLNPLDYRKILEMEVAVKKEGEIVQKIRSSVEPLLKQLKRLTPDQREKATELMFRAETMDQEIKKKEDERARLLGTLPPCTEVELRVTGKILPNSQIHVCDKFATIHEEIKGPVKLVVRLIEGRKEMLLINQITGSVRTLVCGKLDQEVLSIPAKPQIAQPGAKSAPPA